MTLSQWKTLQRVFISAGIKPDSSCRRQDPVQPGLASLQPSLRFHSGNTDLLSATHQAPLCSPTSALAVPRPVTRVSWPSGGWAPAFHSDLSSRFLLEAKRLPQHLADAHPPASHSLRVTGLLSSEPLSSLCVSISLGPQSVTNLRLEAPNCAFHCYRPAREQAWNMVGSREILVESLTEWFRERPLNSLVSLQSQWLCFFTCKTDVPMPTPSSGCEKSFIHKQWMYGRHWAQGLAAVVCELWLKSAVDTWTTRVCTARVQLYADFFSPINTCSTEYVVSLPHDFNNLFFSLAYFIVRI